ncbi:MMPL family transporter [Paenibacillus elgii]|uniref:MMPL family transporter n=1 Tax=Paenibacillus elgii TaxID=189691 RepID=UPI00203AB49B|nr:MMPL family transporter [Paenibacillus elgii]MCM3269929.1 MMPL family transporter [Paenibacillus elgii]
MLRALHTFSSWVSSPKGAKSIVAGWLLLVVVLAAAAPSAKKFAISSGEGSVKENTPSAAAQQIMDEQFPSADGLTALLVLHGKQAITAEERAKIRQLSEWLASDSKPQHVTGALPFHRLPEAAQDRLFSEDRKTLLLNVTLEKGLESDRIYDTLKQIREQAGKIGLGELQLEMTGPAGIAADTIALFKNADFVLMLATVGLILVILLLIYRSPLLAVLPLVISGVVYEAVDRVLGLSAKNGWLVVDKQALSIMMILLFAVLTDYCLFVFSRYREQLGKVGSKHDAMRLAMNQVAEPILFSGGTVLVAMLVLFAAVFKPYHYFAPVFAVAMVVILLSGLTLIPAVFTLVGRKAFWPFVPKLEERDARPAGLWAKAGSLVARRPGMTAGVLTVLLLFASFNIGGIKYSFNLLKSFPDTASSRQGFELLEQSYPPGQLAPVTVILQSDRPLTEEPQFREKLTSLTGLLAKQTGVDSVEPKPDTVRGEWPVNMLSQDRQSVRLQLLVKGNPYDPAALDALNAWRGNSETMLKDSGFDPLRDSLHFAGQTAQQLDVRAMNERDTLVLFSLIGLLITVMLGFQTRSLLMPVYMMLTILLSYAATMGLGWAIAHGLLGYDAISYRLPVYTFVFLVALGVDYNIMLVSRVKEEARKTGWSEAVSRGVSLTGGVISSAGLILAATFGVLMTQPLQELFLFGLTMTIGILIDTFLVRGLLLPSIMVLTGKRKPSSAQTPQVHSS